MSSVEEQPVGPAILDILARLREIYGKMPWRPHGDGITELILTILSQHTNDMNSGRGFANLLSVFPDWDAVRDAPVTAIAEATRAAGLSTSKAPRIKQALERIYAERGDYCLTFLSELPLDEARSWLIALPGVGPKTAACVLMFALGRPALPVDTHVFRVASRLGLLPAKSTAESAHQFLERAVPPELAFEFHISLIKHGRHCCRARWPACAGCVLNEICPSAFQIGPAAGSITAVPGPATGESGPRPAAKHPARAR
jgi:endonuclease-3